MVVYTIIGNLCEPLKQCLNSWYGFVWQLSCGRFFFSRLISPGIEESTTAEDCAFRRAQEISMWRMQQAMAIELLDMT